jgi:integrase
VPLSEEDAVAKPQRELFRRWTTGDHGHPHEALMGILALLHGASSTEVRLLQITDIDPLAQTVRLGKRPHPVPLDPASWTVLQRCLAHREAWATANPHVMVTKEPRPGGTRPQLPIFHTSLTTADTRPE